MIIRSLSRPGYTTEQLNNTLYILGQTHYVNVGQVLTQDLHIRKMSMFYIQLFISAAETSMAVPFWVMCIQYF